MCFINATKTAALQGTKHNDRNDKIQLSSAGVLTGKTKSSSQQKTTSIPITSEFGGKGVHTDCWLCDINGEFRQVCVLELPYGGSQ